MKVTLLKKVGDHPEGKELEITDESVLRAWSELGVIDPVNGLDEEDENYNPYAKMKVDEIRAKAEEIGLPKEEWEKLKKDELINYLTEKLS